ncbi:MAG: hypothetical protein ABIG44_09865 [Planctomycetota bacterium]
MKMKRKTHSRWLVLSAMVAGLLCQTGPCCLPTDGTDQTQDLAQQVGLYLQQTATNVVADTVFFFLDNLLVRWTT